MEFVVEWLDMDFKLHKTKYSPKGRNVYGWNDKRQIRSSQRENVRQILQRYRI